MKTYIVTMVGAPGQVSVEADGFCSRGDGDLVFYRDGDPITEPSHPPEEPDAPPLPPYTYRPKVLILAYASGIWRSVMDSTTTVTYQTAQGRAQRENPERRQKT